MRDVENIIRKVDGNMAIEDMKLTVDDKERIRMCLTGKRTFDETIRQLVEEHTVKRLASI